MNPYEVARWALAISVSAIMLSLAGMFVFCLARSVLGKDQKK